MFKIRTGLAIVCIGSLLIGCRPAGVEGFLSGVASGVEALADGGNGTLIRSKRTSSLSADRGTITLSIDAAAPDGSAVTLAWDEPSQMGTLNATRGANVQWAANPGVSGTAVIRVKASGGGKNDECLIRLPIANGQIKPAELTPEVTVAPQSATLFRPLPTSLGLSEDQLLAMGIRTQVTLGVTTYRFNPATNEKDKTAYDPAEVKWTTSDADLLTVSEMGRVRPASGAKVGEAAIAAVSKTDAGQRASALIRVRYLSTKIDLSFDRTTVTPGATLPLKASVTYTNPDDRGRVVYTDPSGREVTWESSDKTKAQVDATGTVKALADATPGSKVTITARSAYDPSMAEPIELTIGPGE